MPPQPSPVGRPGRPPCGPASDGGGSAARLRRWGRLAAALPALATALAVAASTPAPTAVVPAVSGTVALGSPAPGSEGPTGLGPGRGSGLGPGRGSGLGPGRGPTVLGPGRVWTGLGFVVPGAAVPGAPPDPGMPDADSARHATPAPAPGTGIPAPGARYAWPLLPVPAVGTPFRAPAHAYAPGHRGVDLVGTVGQPVTAARAGTVVYAGAVAGRPLVSVQHDDGLRTTYEPVAPVVTAGDVVAAGTVLGTLEPGHAACPGTETCLHWGVRRDRLDYLDPLVLLRPARVRLLPVPEPWPG